MAGRGQSERPVQNLPPHPHPPRPPQLSVLGGRRVREKTGVVGKAAPILGGGGVAAAPPEVGGGPGLTAASLSRSSFSFQ